MPLSDNEKRDVIKYLESGKPLPEKYRFLLFDETNRLSLFGMKRQMKSPVYFL